MTEPMIEQLRRWGFRPIDTNGQPRTDDEPTQVAQSTPTEQSKLKTSEIVKAINSIVDVQI
jgi:hypothetical protein